MEDAPMQLPTAGSVFVGVRKGAWTPEEDLLLKKCIETYGEGQWHLVPTRAGLRRCRKSCRLRWLNYLKPTIKRGLFDQDEVDLILRLHKLLGNRWSLIAGRIPGRTANDIKNYWNSSLSKRLSANWQGVVNSKVIEGSTAEMSLKQPSRRHPSGIRETPGAVIPSSVLKPQPRIPSKSAFPWPKTYDACHETSREPSATNDKPAEEEDALSWWRTFLEDNEGEGEGQQQQWGQENIVSFPGSSQAGGVELLHKSPWTEEIEGCVQWWSEGIFLDADRPLGRSAEA